MSATDAIPLRRSSTDLPALIAGTVETLQEQAAALDVALTVDAQPGLPLVNVDAEKIAWAVATLVGNAFRYVRRGSRRRPGGGIHVQLRAEDGSVVIRVEDDGPGITPDKLERLLVRGAGVRHGAGLGLMLIQDVVVAHGGTIEVQSRSDGFESGTTVVLRVPVT